MDPTSLPGHGIRSQALNWQEVDVKERQKPLPCLVEIGTKNPLSKADRTCTQVLTLGKPAKAFETVERPKAM